MIVMKFGGSSVANADRIRHIAEIIKEYRDRRPVVVLSAMGDTTDDLIEAAKQENIPIISTSMSSFETAGKLYLALHFSDNV